MDTAGIFAEIFKDYKKPEKDIVGKLSDLWGEYTNWAEGGDDTETRKAVEAFNKYSGFGPGMLAGGYSPAAPIKRLAKAFSMESKGASLDDIWQATKTQKFPWDQRYRWEIPTTEAKFTSLGEDLLSDPKMQNKAASIWDAFDFPELQKAYADLKDIKFGATNKIPGRGSFSGKDRMIAVRPYDWQNTDFAYDPLSTTLHELQHWIQLREKFSRGYNPTGPNAVQKVFNTPEEAAKYAEYARTQTLPNLKFEAQTNRRFTDHMPTVSIRPDKVEQELYNFAGGELESKAVQARDRLRRAGIDIDVSPLYDILGQMRFNNPLATLEDVIPIANWKGLFE